MISAAWGLVAVLSAGLIFCVWRLEITRRLLREAVSETLEATESSKSKSRTTKEEKNRILGVLESMAEGVAVIDPKDRVVLANSVLEKILSLHKNQIEQRFFWEVFRDSTLNDVIRRAAAEKIPVQLEHSILLSEAMFQIQISPVLNEGRFLGVVVVFHDITKLKKLERMRSEFVANVSHELKTPLTSIMGFVETLKEGAVEDKENRVKFLEIIEEHSKKLYSLIEGLLLLSKVESQDAISKEEDVSLEKMIPRIFESMTPMMLAKKIESSYGFSSIPFTVRGDPKSLEEMFKNLIENAVKYNQTGGKVKIRGVREGGQIKIAVEDTGIGIPEADLPRIFERFYRVDKSRSSDTGGSGLGLSIAKHVAEKHGGRIQAQSILEKGSVFTVYLPA